MLKLDLEKAFNWLEWSFVYCTLIFFKFPQNLINLIMNCMTSSSIFMLVNDSLINYFLPSRGIFHGGPMSPHIFILYRELLSTYIYHQVDILKWDAVSTSRNGTVFSHLSLLMTLV